MYVSDSDSADDMLDNMIDGSSSSDDSEYSYNAGVEHEANVELIVAMAATADSGEDSDDDPMYTAVAAATACGAAAAADGHVPSEHELTLSMLSALRFDQYEH
jgi:hypothetical protein